MVVIATAYIKTFGKFVESAFESLKALLVHIALTTIDVQSKIKSLIYK